MLNIRLYLATLDNLAVDGKSIYELAHELDQMVHGDWNPTTRSYSRKSFDQMSEQHLGKERRFQSRLQQMLVDFAGSNFIVRMPNGEVKIIRDYVPKNLRGSKEVHYDLAFPSLIGPISAEAKIAVGQEDGKHTINVPKVHVVQEAIQTKLLDWLNSKVAGGVTRADAYDITPPDLSAPGARLIKQLLTISDLETIFTPQRDGRLSHLNNGAGLKEGLNDMMFYGKYLPPMDGKLQTRFSHVTPAEITVSPVVASVPGPLEASSVALQRPKEQKFVPKGVKRVADINLDDDISTSEIELELRKALETDLGKTVTVQEATSLFKKYFKLKATPKVYTLDSIMDKLIKDKVIKKDC